MCIFLLNHVKLKKIKILLLFPTGANQGRNKRGKLKILQRQPLYRGPPSLMYSQVNTHNPKYPILKI